MEQIKKYHLSDEKILKIFLSSLKEIYKQQEIKKKNYKKLIGYYTIKAQKYEDSSTSTEMNSRPNKKIVFVSSKKKNTKIQPEYTTEYSYQSDSSIFTNKEKDNKNNNTNNNNNFDNNYNRNIKTLSINKYFQNEKMKALKHKIYKQIDLKNSKKFRENELSYINLTTNHENMIQQFNDNNNENNENSNNIDNNNT